MTEAEDQVKNQFAVLLPRVIHLIITLYSFNAWVKIAVFNVWKLFVNQFHQLFYAHHFASFSYTYLAEIPIGVNIKIAPLYHSKVSVDDKFAQGFVFFHAVRHTGKHKVVNACPTTI